MDYLTSYDVDGPIGRIRMEKFWVEHDPTGLRRHQRYDFEIEIAESVSLTARASVLAGASELKTGSTFNDYHGFGSCRREAEQQAAGFEDTLFGSGLDIVVIVKAEWNAVVFDMKAPPFYNGTVRCFMVPRRWWRDEGAQRLVPENREFEVYRNGQPGEDAEAFEAFLAEARAMDTAQDRRKPLHNGSREVR